MPKIITENQLRQWIGNTRRARDGGTDYIFYPELMAMAIKAGLPNLFDRSTPEDKSNIMTMMVCVFHKERGRYPNRIASSEKKLGNWLHARRQAKQGNGKVKWHPSDQAIADELGYSKMFDIGGESDEMTRKVCAFHKEHGRYPSQKAEDDEERKLGIWLSSRRKAKQGKGEARWYPSNQVIADKLGYPGVFDVKKRAKTKG